MSATKNFDILQTRDMARLPVHPVWIVSLGMVVLAIVLSAVDIHILTAKGAARMTTLHPFHLVSVIAALVSGCCLWWATRMHKRATLSEHALETSKRYYTRFEDGMAIWFCDDVLIRATHDVRNTFEIQRGMSLDDSLDAICSKFRDSDCQAIRDDIAELQRKGRSFRLWLPMIDEKAVVIVSGRPEGASFVVRFVNATQEAKEVAQLAARSETTIFEHQQIMQMLNITPILMWRRTQSLRLSWANQAYADAVQADIRTVILEQKELSLGAMSAGAAINLARKAYTSESASTERRAVVLNGRKRTLDIYETPHAEGTIGYALDVTHLVEAQESLSQQQSEYANTLDELHTGVALFDAKRKLHFYNEALARLLQLDMEWLSEQPDHFEIIDRLRQRRRLPEWPDFKSWRQSLADLYKQETDSLNETWHLPDGTIFNVIYKSRASGGVLILFEDVTDKIALERQYNTLIGLRKATFEQLSEGLIVFGMDGYTQFANAAFSSIWQIEPDRMKTRPHISDIIQWCQTLYTDQEDWQQIQSIVTTSGVKRRWHDLISCSDGRTLNVNISPLPDGSMLLAFRDVTDAQNIENALREKASALEAADTLKSEFMGHISYQLRTPLNTVLGFGEILKREMFGSLNHQQKEYVDGILHSSSTLLRVLSDILDLSSIEAGTFGLSIGQVDVYRIVSSLEEMVTKRVQDKRLHFRLDCPKDIGLFDGDENRIRQLLFKLLQNAIKYTGEGGQIVLGCARDSQTGNVVVWVRDTGEGISKEDLDAVFETFNGVKRIRHERRAGGAGIGIGLTLVKKFVELHNGHIRIDSQVDKGTCVYCTFPASQEKQLLEKAG